MHLGSVRAEGTADELKDQVGPDATLDDVFRHFTGNSLKADTDTKGGMRDVRTTRRTAGRVG